MHVMPFFWYDTTKKIPNFFFFQKNSAAAAYRALMIGARKTAVTTRPVLMGTIAATATHASLTDVCKPSNKSHAEICFNTTFQSYTKRGMGR